MKVKLAPHIQLWQHQVYDAAFFWRMKRAMNLSEMGAGKTLPTAVTAAALLKSGRAQRCVVVCLRSLMNNWTEAFERQLDMGVTTYQYHGTGRSKSAAVQADVVVTTYQILVNELLAKSKKKNWRGERRRVNPEAFFYKYMRMFRTVVVFDEAAKMRRTESKRSFAGMAMAHMADRAYFLTGNPSPNGHVDLYPLLKMVEPESYSSLQHFMHEHCVMSSGAFPIVVGYKNEERITQLLAKYSVRHLKAECLDLPPKTYVVRELNMSEEHARIYNDGLADKFLELPDGRIIEMQNAFSIIIRARQLATGPFLLGYEEQGPKLEQLEEDLEAIGSGHKVVVFIEYVKSAHAVKGLAERLGWRVGMMCDTTNYDPVKELAKFHAGEVDLLVVHPESGGLGVNLSAAQYNVFYEYSYNLELHDQALERSHRQGLSGPLTVIYYVVKDTIEEGMLEALQRKKTVSSDLMRDPVWLRSFVKYSERVRSNMDPTMGVRF